MRTVRRVFCAATAACALLDAAVGCSLEDPTLDRSDAGTGGAGAMAGTGGIPGSSGAPAQGGSGGGILSSGGSSGSGGLAAGGAIAGGSVGAGGDPGAGGLSNTGGVPSMGGTGGSPGPGGAGNGGTGPGGTGNGGTGTGGAAPATGGSKTTGGTSGTGGAAPTCPTGNSCTDPSFGAGFCQGGNCVQCRQDTDCPTPAAGSCRVRHCDTATNRCSPQVASNRTDCQLTGRTGVCSSGTCTGCIDQTDCQRLSPTTPVCSVGRCVECTTSDLSACDAATCRAAVCSSNTCGEQITPWASCSSGRVCNASGICATACNNGHLDSGEECESGVGGWTIGKCDTATCSRNGYKRCSATRDCASTQFCAGINVCIENCDSGCTTLAPPGFTATCYESLFCVIACSGNSQCPTGLVCVSTNPAPPGKTGICQSPAPRVCDCTGGDCSGCLFPIIGP